jgi:hypothetical protein
MWAAFVCFSFMLGFLTSYRPLPLYDSDRIEGWFNLVSTLYADVDHFKESGTLDLIQMGQRLSCIKVKNP